MTVSYTAEVATCRGFGCFLKLLFRWKGSIYKLVWPDLFLFLGSYFSLNFLYRFFLNPEQQKSFAQIAIYCEKQGALIPVSFVLGFYVSIVVGRWWDQYRTIPWPDGVALFVSSNIHGQDDRGRLVRRTIMRYCCLSLTMVFASISPRVKKRFPTMDHLVDAGLLQESERKIIEALNLSVPTYSKTWLPIIWAASICTRARNDGKIRDDASLKTLLDELNKFRSQCGLLISYDWISVPLVYTQVVTLAVYSYFLSCVMGRQYLNSDHREANGNIVNSATGGTLEELDLIFPIFTTLQFFFYMGWLKVAESLVNPFGDDDDDFELNWLVDRNLQVSYLIVDEMHHEYPELVKDQYWDEVLPTELPYTLGSEQFREDPPTHSTDKIQVSRRNSLIVSPPSIKLDDLAECLVSTNLKSTLKNRSSSSPQFLSVPTEDSADGRRHSRTPSLKSNTGSYFPWRHERNASIRSNASQSTLAESVTGKVSRAGSIHSVLRRLLSKDKADTHHLEPSHKCDTGTTVGAQAHSLADDVIPELDENMTTIVSMRSDNKPTISDVFGDSLHLPSDGKIQKSPVINIPGSSGRQSDPLFVPPSSPPTSSHWPEEVTPSNQNRDVSTNVTLPPKIQVQDYNGITDNHKVQDTRLNIDEQNDKIHKKLAKVFGAAKNKGRNNEEGTDEGCEDHLLQDFNININCSGDKNNS